MSRRAKIRLFIAFVVAALWLPCTLYLAPGSWGAFSFFAVGLITVPTTVFIACPLVYLLRRRLTFLTCTVSGLVIGFIVSLVFTDLESARDPMAALRSIIPYAVVGILSSNLFWVIGVWRNRDLTIGWSNGARLR